MLGAASTETDELRGRLAIEVRLRRQAEDQLLRADGALNAISSAFESITYAAPEVVAEKRRQLERVVGERLSAYREESVRE